MNQIWESTILEITDIAESRKRTLKAREKAKAGHIFVLANAISSRIAYFFADEKSRSEDMILQPWQAYPEFFKDIKQEAEDRKEKQQMEIQRQKVIDWANHINALRHKK